MFYYCGDSFLNVVSDTTEALIARINEAILDAKLGIQIKESNLEINHFGLMKNGKQVIALDISGCLTNEILAWCDL